MMGNLLCHEWLIVNNALPALLPGVARENGTLHLSYDPTRDLWTVVNDSGYAALRARAAEGLRAALDDEEVR